MGDSESIVIGLPGLHYELGEELTNSVKIDQHANASYIEKVKTALGDEAFQRIRDSFLGPLIKLHGRSKRLLLSGKMLHVILTRSLKTNKKNELLFHFAGQPMRFSIREFHMVTGLKCHEYEEEEEDSEEEEEEELRYKWNISKQGHKVEQLMEILENMDDDNPTEEKFCLGMLIIMEGLFFQNHAKYKLPYCVLKNYKADIHVK